MTDDGHFLSRRERRAQEEREAANVPADTDALALGPISESIPTHAPDGRMLSRRERRRLERARQPMETWTAEEEMIATGQIPAMTPERIAEQEKLAREQAAAAQREAQEASAELEGLAGHPAVAPSAAEAVTQPPAEPSAQQIDDQPAEQPDMPQWAPVAQSDAPVAAVPEPQEPWAPSAPGDDQDTPHADSGAPRDEAQSGEQQPPARTSLIAAVAADVNQDAPQEQEPVPEENDASAPSAPATFEPEPEPEPDSTAIEAEQAAPQAPASTPAIPGMPPGMSPEMFAELFPPGSLQRRMMEDQAASDAATEPEPEDPAAEIRRLTEEAVAGLDVARGRGQEEPAPHQDSATVPVESASPDPSASAPDVEPQAPWQAPAVQPQASWEAPVSQSAPQDYGQPSSPSAPGAPAADSGPPTFSIPTFDPEGQTDEPSAHSAPSAMPPAETAPVPPALAPLDEAPFDAILGDHPETAALDEASNASGAFGSPQFGEVGTERAPQAEQAPQEATGIAPAPGANAPWGVHPLSQVDREAPQLPEMPPAQSVPHPDLSSVGFRGPTAEQGPVPIVEPVPTGQIEVPPRERPELTGADVPRHFKWAHLAVFGAVGLLLGVVVWQVI